MQSLVVTNWRIPWLWKQNANPGVLERRKAHQCEKRTASQNSLYSEAQCTRLLSLLVDTGFWRRAVFK